MANLQTKITVFLTVAMVSCRILLKLSWILGGYETTIYAKFHISMIYGKNVTRGKTLQKNFDKSNICDAPGLNILYSDEKNLAHHTTWQCPLQHLMHLITERTRYLFILSN